jgi:hypothetical protein
MIKVPSEQEIWREAFDILNAQMGPAKAMRLISAMRIGGGDYLSLRDELFGGISARELLDKARNYEKDARPVNS